MADDVTQPVFLDATVLSNFASSGSIAELAAILDRPVAVPTVRDELEEGYDRNYEFLDTALGQLGDGIALLEVTEGTDDAGTEIRRQLDAGEAESLLGAIEQDGTLATDDRAARTLAARFEVPVTGSIGILAVGVRRGVLEIDDANEWLDVWRERRGYYAPVDRIQDVVQ